MVYSLLNDKEVIHIYQKYVDTIYRICFMYMKNIQDTEDMVQSTFVQFMNSNKLFENENHIKGWLIVTASNLCKNQLKHWWRKNTDLENIEATSTNHIDHTLEQILKLPKKYKLIIYLYYYEGYQTNEIGKQLNMNESTVRSYLRRGRLLLKEVLEGGNYEE